MKKELPTKHTKNSKKGSLPLSLFVCFVCFVGKKI
jgi:hypothetical protein